MVRHERHWGSVSIVVSQIVGLRRTRVLGGSTLVALLLALAACGGGSGGPPGSSSATSGQQFRSQADAICLGAEKEAKSLVGASGRLVPESLDRAVTLLKRTAAELSRVAPPPALRAGYQRYLAEARQEIGLTAKLAHDVDTRNLAGVRSVEHEINGEVSNNTARSLGLTVCAREVS